MTVEITVNSNPATVFQDKIIKKLQTDFGKLMPKEVLQGLVERAVTEQFFKYEKIPKPGREHWSSEMIEGPSWFVKAVFKEAEPLLRESVAAWVQENEATLKEAVDQFLKDQNLLLIATAAIGAQLAGHFEMASANIINTLSRR